MSVQQFCLRWNNHQPNFISVFSSLLHNETLVDVTLAAEGNQLQAHKVVLSACSTYFESLFTLNPCKHPIVILKDVRYSDLKTLVDFMYYGEVNVSQERLPHIIKTAEMLKIKGLAEMSDAASLSKSDSKSSSGGSGSGGGDQLSANVNDGESVWGGHESHHQQHQQQQQQQQQQEQFHQQQQSQLQQQQHHQIQQTSNRRTPSPNSTMSPSTRRKRLRKSSTGIPEFALRKDLHQQQSVPAPPPQYEEEFRPSGVTSSSGEEHSSMEGLAVTAAAAGGGSGSSLVPNSIHIGHLEAISTFGGASTASNLTTTVQQQQQQQNQRMLKESPNTELDHHHHHHQQQQQQHHHHHHDTSQESVDDQQQQHHIVMKTEIHELQQQPMPLDITTSSATGQSCPTQTHSGVQWTVVESGYPRFALASCQSNIGMSGGGNQNNNNNSNASSSNSNNNGAAASAAAQQQQQQHHHHQQAAATHQSTAEAHHHNQHNNSKAMGSKRGRLLIRQPRVKKEGEAGGQTLSPEEVEFVPQFGGLRVPHRIERHSSEPAPSTMFVSYHHPSTSSSTQSHLLTVPHSSTTAYLVKQHSHPLLPSQTSTAASSSGSIQRQLSQPVQDYAPSSPQHYTSTSGNLSGINIILSTSSPSSSPIVSSENVTLPSNLTQFISSQLKSSASAEEPIEFVGRMKTSTPPMLIVPETMTGSLEYVSSIRVKSDELKRSISTPQTQTREFSLDNPRSSHCPAVRPGPALGCNFCWNTIDQHGRILRRKTKYHCPECQTNLCIVPCFQEYHERQTNESSTSNSSSTTTTNTTTTATGQSSSTSLASSLSADGKAKLSTPVVLLTTSHSEPSTSQQQSKSATITVKEFSKTGSL